MIQSYYGSSQLSRLSRCQCAGCGNDDSISNEDFDKLNGIGKKIRTITVKYRKVNIDGMRRFLCKREGQSLLFQQYYGCQFLCWNIRTTPPRNKGLLETDDASNKITIRSSRIAREFLQNNVPIVLDWASNSPDRNHIENLWKGHNIFIRACKKN